MCIDEKKRAGNEGKISGDILEQFSMTKSYRGKIDRKFEIESGEWKNVQQCIL